MQLIAPALNCVMTPAFRRFAALGHRDRYEIMRLLAGAGYVGIPSGELAAALGMPPSTTSSHLKVLLQAQLVTVHPLSTMNSRKGRYRVSDNDVCDLVQKLISLRTDT